MIATLSSCQLHASIGEAVKLHFEAFIPTTVMLLKGETRTPMRGTVLAFGEAILYDQSQAATVGLRQGPNDSGAHALLHI